MAVLPLLAWVRIIVAEAPLNVNPEAFILQNDWLPVDPIDVQIPDPSVRLRRKATLEL